jgi:hypothetical protein
MGVMGGSRGRPATDHSEYPHIDPGSVSDRRQSRTNLWRYEPTYRTAASSRLPRARWRARSASFSSAVLLKFGLEFLRCGLFAHLAELGGKTSYGGQC